MLIELSCTPERLLPSGHVSSSNVPNHTDAYTWPNSRVLCGVCAQVTMWSATLRPASPNANNNPLVKYSTNWAKVSLQWFAFDSGSLVFDFLSGLGRDLHSRSRWCSCYASCQSSLATRNWRLVCRLLLSSNSTQPVTSSLGAYSCTPRKPFQTIHTRAPHHYSAIHAPSAHNPSTGVPS